MSGFYIDAGELRAVQRQLGASHKQLTLAYNRALRRTLRALKVKSVTTMTDLTGAAEPGYIKKHRVKSYYLRGVDKQVPAAGKIWFGLDDMPVSALLGRIINAPAQKRERDRRGRFVATQGGGVASFIPRSQALGAQHYPGAFMAVFRGKASLYTREPGKPWLREMKVPVMDRALKRIELRVFSPANATLMKLFTKELEGLVRRGYEG